MRHKLDLLTKDNESDMQLSNPVSLKHAENIRKRAASPSEAKNMFPCEDLAAAVGYGTTGRQTFIHPISCSSSDNKSVTVSGLRGSIYPTVVGNKVGFNIEISAGSSET